MPDELDLEKLFLPAWAQEPASANLYAKYEGEEMPDRRGDRRDRPRRREGAPFARDNRPRREGGQDRPRGRNQGGDRGRGPGAPPGTMPQGGRPERPGRPGQGRRDRPAAWGDRRERRPPPPPFVEVA